MHNDKYDQSAMLLAVAPNGARKQYHDHPALPLRIEELAQTATSCLEAGATLMHVHVRDEKQGYQHCIDAKKYSQAFTAIRANVGQEMFLQATTEAVGRYDANSQMAMVRELADLERHKGLFGVSLAVRELMHPTMDLDRLHRFFTFLQAANILPQLIIYDQSDRNRFQSLLQQGVLPGQSYPCLLVLGRYQQGLTSKPSALLPFFSNLQGISSWMGCAFGMEEGRVAQAAALLGGHMRIGYENNTLLSDGRISDNNAQLIAQTCKQLPALGRRPATREETQQLMTPLW